MGLIGNKQFFKVGLMLSGSTGDNTDQNGGWYPILGA